MMTLMMSPPLQHKPAVTWEGNGTSITTRAMESDHCSATGSVKRNVCLRIIPVVVKGQGQHSEIETNALLDPESDLSLCDLGLMTNLGVDGSPKEFTLATVNSTSEPQNGCKVSLVVRGLHLYE